MSEAHWEKSGRLAEHVAFRLIPKMFFDATTLSVGMTKMSFGHDQHMAREMTKDLLFVLEL